MEAEMAGMLLLFVFAWIAGAKASGLLYQPTGKAMHRKAGKQLFWAVLMLLPGAAAEVAIGGMTVSLHPLLWQDRLYIHAPLTLIPLLAVAGLSIPKLLKLRKAAPEAAPDAELRRLAADPGMIVPFQAAALGALTSFYFALNTPIPLQWNKSWPVLICLAAIVLLWVRHDLRQGAASKTNAIVRRRPWLTLSVYAIIAAALGAGAWIAATQAQAQSKLPAELSMSEGVPDYGGGSIGAGMAAMAGMEGMEGHDHAHIADSADATPVTALTGPQEGTPDRRFTLTAQKASVKLSSGKTVEAWTYNGQIPGPELRVKQGELVEVTLTNQDIEDGVTVHWHGLDVPNAEDGVAGVTQDAVLPGQTYTYRFIANQTGTYWYHSHQNSQQAVQKGLFGTLIVEPRETDPAVKDITVITHMWNGRLAFGTSDTTEALNMMPGTPVRLRLINTDDWVRQRYLLTGAPFQVTAIDGTDVADPALLENTRLELTTGGRYDIEFTMPDHPVLLSLANGGKLGLLMNPNGTGSLPEVPSQSAVFDPARYGAKTQTPFDRNSKFDREFTMVLDNKFGFYNGQFNNLYTINGELFPNTPMFMVREGDLVKTTIINRSAVDHPMHLHGHHMLVLTRNGQPVSGTWWSDTLDVQPGDTFEVAFRADNPGLWMDHCHNLSHAAVGMSMHLMYEGVTTPFMVGTETVNHPE
ncbi:multicopper oxidase family protein [Paenibacillus athensensis]|uniref:Copper oxidase n=2 Tax=Paenibacillus athensensis TaxID=1967502 RepID=A0A4Y8Q8Z6_9BACL|nr:multicopper oxidase family protein [Paenibacillus athensensis]